MKIDIFSSLSYIAIFLKSSFTWKKMKTNKNSKRNVQHSHKTTNFNYYYWKIKSHILSFTKFLSSLGNKIFILHPKNTRTKQNRQKKIQCLHVICRFNQSFLKTFFFSPSCVCSAMKDGNEIFCEWWKNNKERKWLSISIHYNTCYVVYIK